MSDWIVELEKANSDLKSASHQIQTAFKDASSKSVSLSGEEIPDPVEILSRVSALESSIVSLQKECNELVQLRAIIACQTTSLLLKNYTAMQELSVLVKGQANATMHHETENLAYQALQQHEYWNSKGNKCTTEIHQQANIEIMKNNVLHLTKSMNKSLPSDQTSRKLLKVYYNSQGSINVDLSQTDFYSIPELIRGRCKIDDIKHVAMFIFKEVTDRREEGLRGKHLHVDRQHIAKHSGGVPGLYSIIMNTSLWRDITSTLRYLGFLRLERDALIMMNSEL